MPKTTTPAQTVDRLWIDNGGRTVCDTHAGHYLGGALTGKRGAARRRVETPITTWEAAYTTDSLHPDNRESLACETCSAHLGADPFPAAYADLQVVHSATLKALETQGRTPALKTAAAAVNAAVKAYQKGNLPACVKATADARAALA